MSKGAANCGVSQSAASQHVKEVERRLGVGLFDRGKRPLELTPAGKALLRFCREVLRREEEFVRASRSLKGSVEGTVRVASIYSIGLSEMSRLQEAFSRRHPAAQLHVEYMRPDKIYEAVREDRPILAWSAIRRPAAKSPPFRGAKKKCRWRSALAPPRRPGRSCIPPT